ncbi:hypothetical protein VTH06DRAFT_2649 [Thermothelomyces fergusii]
MASTKTEGLNVIALVSGGKDSFFSLLHCRANGHRIVALANLHPPLPRRQGSRDGTSQPRLDASVPAISSRAPESTPCGRCGGSHLGSAKDARPPAVLPGGEGGATGNEIFPEADEDGRDLNSFMYQTVGHQVIPLYAEATGIPLYRREITGAAVQHGKDYDAHRHRSSAARPAGGDSDAAPGPEVADPDETESMVPLLQDIMRAHPEANALCAGAILSTYQRTRVESVAIRLGLTPLAYLWKFPILPVAGPSGPVAGTDAQLLDDMAAAGVEARIIKVASGGLDDSFLWTNVASPAGKTRLATAMRRFGPAETGAVIGEGGEFETLVLDGPPALFHKRIVVADEDCRMVREGGGSAWLSLRNARLEDKPTSTKDDGGNIRTPSLLDPGFVKVLNALSGSEALPASRETSTHARDDDLPRLGGTLQPFFSQGRLEQWSFTHSGRASASIEASTRVIVEDIRRRLGAWSLPASAILSATIVLRRMADFPAVNRIYGTLFDAPNPPSRVTISCGDAADANIAIYLTVLPFLQPNQRHGLHVQSRSYWAPANIGPYSQAISVPLPSLGRTGAADATASSGPRLVSIAGQIPLVPATMALPDSGGGGGGGRDALSLQLTLSLQHLWRIGVEMGVQWWTSVVAYVPACRALAGDEGEERSDETEMVQKARMVGEAWRAAHSSNGRKQGDDDDDDENGPDLWDRRFNPQYMTFSSLGGGERKAGPALPDPSVLAPPSRGRRPPAFVAEVDELPRGAGVEWHAHLGIAGAAERSVLVRETVAAEDEGSTHVAQTIIRPPEDGLDGVGFVQTVVAERLGGRRGPGEHDNVAAGALARLGTVDRLEAAVAVVRYVDVEVLRAAGERGMLWEDLGPVVPCRSLWDGDGRRLAAVSVYHSVFE